MAGVAEADLYTLAQLEDLSVLLGIEELEGLLRVCQGVEGLYLLPAGPLSLLVLPLGVSSGMRPEWSIWAWVTKT